MSTAPSLPSVVDPNSLAAKVNSPRVDVIPGYSLCTLRLKEMGLLEQEIASDYLRKVYNSLNGQNSPLAITTMQMAMDSIKNGTLKYGMPAYNDYFLSLSSVPFLLFLSLKKYHQNITLEQASALLSEDNDYLVHQAILELNGYINRAPSTVEDIVNRGIDWNMVIGGLRKLGHTIEAIAELTLPQISFELSGWKLPEDKTQFVDKVKIARNKIFDAVLVQFKISKTELAQLSVTDLKERIAAVEPRAVGYLNDDALLSSVAEYVK